MPFRATAGRLLLAGVALAAVTVAVPDLPSAAADSTSLNANPSAAKPGVAVVVTGKIPAQAGKPYTVSQIYTNNHVARVRTPESPPLVAETDGSVRATVTVPVGASRSDLLRPYGSWQYDVVTFDFGPGCPFSPSCTEYGANVNVLPIRTDQHITLGTLAPRTGSQLSVHAVNCVGGTATEFTRVIDGNGAYFPITGATSGTTFTGSADLSKGYRGKYGATGPAHVSNPIGTRDSLAGVPCLQSEGPSSVADADNLEHLSMVVDITICPATGRCAISSAVAPAGQKPVYGAPAAGPEVVAAAVPAQAITAQPTFVG